MQQTVFQAAHGLFRDANLHITHEMAALGGSVHPVDPQKLPPLLPCKITLTAPDVIQMQNLPWMAKVLDVVLRLQKVSKGLRIDQTAAEFMEDKSHGLDATKRGAA